ncbi:MAG: NAD(P)-dependent oxidoreductase [Deltaproteobacteria bacterium]|nr:NAD(P)-dependent oxidoreductase [Deltaproteobacteria bacterium]
MSSLIYGASGFVATNLIPMLSRFGRNHFILIDNAEKPEIPNDVFKGCKVDKAAGEMIIHNYRDVYGISVSTLRSCNLIGKGQRPPKERGRNI